MKTILLAVGGNSLIRAGEKGTMAEQLGNARRTAREIAGLLGDGFHIVVTHGNGPQVGAALLRSEAGASQVPPLPLDVCGAATQGEIGYILQQVLEGELRSAKLKVPVVSVVTQTVISLDDPAMKHPNKPVGPFYSREEAERKRQLGWQIVEDAARGYRRVVPSPEPVEVVELDVIRGLADGGALVIACGGGGIPVAMRDGQPVGVEAVIDKDRASALLASRLHADMFVISTDTDYVYLDYKKPGQRPLKEVRVDELERYMAEGHFPPGSMGPKVQSALRFLRDGGKEAIIASAENLRLAVSGQSGTHMYPDKPARKPEKEAKTAHPAGGRRS